VALKAILPEYRRRVRCRFVRAAQGAGDKNRNDSAATEQERNLAPVDPSCELSSARSFHRVVVLFYVACIVYGNA
jgi:hypothetical protein